MSLFLLFCPCFKLDKSILKEEENDSQLTKDIKRRVVTDLLSCYPSSGEVSEILHLATFLYPHFKCKPFTESGIVAIKEAVFKKLLLQLCPVQSSNSSSLQLARTVMCSFQST